VVCYTTAEFCRQAGDKGRGMRTSFLTGLLAVAMLLGGCGGYYTVTLPDHVAAAGEEAPVVVRAQGVPLHPQVGLLASHAATGELEKHSPREHDPA